MSSEKKATEAPDNYKPRTELIQKYIAVFKDAWQNRNAYASSPRYRASEADFLPSALAISERPTPIMPRVTLWSIMALIVFGIGWAVIGKVDVVVVAPGKILASGKTKSVNSLESQIVRAIHVKEGQTVEIGDILVEFDPITSNADIQKHQTDISKLNENIDIYKKLINQREDEDNIPKFNSKENDVIFQTRWNDYKSRISKLIAEADGKKKELDTLEIYLNDILKKIPARQKMTDDYKRMFAAGAISRHAFVEKQVALDDLFAEINQAKARIEEARMNLLRSQRDLDVLRTETYANWHDKILEAEKEMNLAKGELSKSLYRRDIAVLRSPASGIVQQLTVMAPGAVVTAGQPVLSVVPSEAITEAEILVENQDIGFLMLNQKVEIKISAYDYTRYGTISGVINYISQDAIADDKGVLHYTARVVLNEAKININGLEKFLLPGMNISADIKYGKRSIFSYFLSPIVKATSEAIREY